MASEEIKRFRREIVERSGQPDEELQAVSVYSDLYILTAFSQLFV